MRRDRTERALVNRLQAQMDAITAGFGAASATGETNREDLALEAPDRTETDAAFKKVVALVNVSDRSERAIRVRLAKAGFSQNVIDEAVRRAKECAFIDDMHFADVLVRSRLSQGRGAAGIERELGEHGIESSRVPGWPHEFGIDDDSELERALDLLERRPPRSKNLREGAYRRLVQKGYASSIAARAARAWHDSIERERRS